MTVNNEMEGMWKKSVMASFNIKFFCWHSTLADETFGNQSPANEAQHPERMGNTILTHSLPAI